MSFKPFQFLFQAKKSAYFLSCANVTALTIFYPIYWTQIHWNRAVKYVEALSNLAVTINTSHEIFFFLPFRTYLLRRRPSAWSRFSFWDGKENCATQMNGKCPMVWAWPKFVSLARQMSSGCPGLVAASRVPGGTSAARWCNRTSECWGMSLVWFYVLNIM